MHRRIDLLTGITFIAFALFIFWASFDIQDFSSIGVGASFAPRLVAVLFVMVGAAIIFLGKNQKSLPAEDTSLKKEHSKGLVGLPAAFLTITLMATYGFLLKYLGFIIASSFYVFFQILILNKSSKKTYFVFILISIISTILIYFIFYKIFGIELPENILK